jgi:hypothetical protein
MLRGKNIAGGLAAGFMLVAGLEQPICAALPSSPAAETSAPSNGVGTAPAQDQRSAYDARQWTAANCVAERRSNTTAGAVIGGLLGAAAGTGLAGRHDHAAGAILGGATGAVAGGAIGSGSTPRDCPPGYIVRPVTPVYYAPPPVYYPPVAYPGVVSAAPGWYNPWFWSGGGWIYRPYPVHRYWYGPYRRW